MSELHVYDTTLRDGAQQEGLNLSVADKLAIAAHLDDLGVGFIEGGWPGANPKDTEFFARARTALAAPRHPGRLRGHPPRRHVGLPRPPGAGAAALGAPVVTLVAKSHLRHVETALRTTAAENLEMVRDTVSFLRGEGRRVFLDAEHFFDGYLADRAYALEVLRTAADAGAEVVALCDTNGGMLPPQVGDVMADALDATGVRLESTATTTPAVRCQFPRRGVGGREPRAGDHQRLRRADRQRRPAHRGEQPAAEAGPRGPAPGRLQEATRIAHAVSEVTNVPPYSRQPYVGASAFAHKAGLHASAIRIDPDLYQHTDPLGVGNDMRMLVSDMAGRASIELKARELGYDLAGQDELLTRIVSQVKDLELRGYTFDAADASFALLLRGAVRGERLSYFDVESWRVITDSVGAGEALSEATVKLVAAGRRVVATGEGNGPVNALDHALRQALTTAYPEIDKLELIDFRVRILDAAHGTDAVTRVLIETSDGTTSWETVGVAPNIVEASWLALVDGITFGLLRQGVPVR